MKALIPVSIAGDESKNALTCAARLDVGNRSAFKCCSARGRLGPSTKRWESNGSKAAAAAGAMFAVNIAENVRLECSGRSVLRS